MDNNKCIELIKEYQSHRLLWDPTSPHHYNKAFKEDSWKIISKKIGISVTEVKKKMTALCGSFRREKSRHKQSLITGSGRNEIYISKWFAYEHFQFLADKFTPRETTSTDKSTTDTMQKEPSTAAANDTYNKETVGTNETLPETSSENLTLSLDDQRQLPSTTPRANKRKETDIFENNIDLDKAIEVLNYTDDTYDTFGKYVAAKLRKYDALTSAHVEKRIMDIIFQADVGMLPGTRQVYYTQEYGQNQTSAPPQNTVGSFEESPTHICNL